MSNLKYIFFICLFPFNSWSLEVNHQDSLLTGSVEDIAFNLLSLEGINYWLLDQNWIYANQIDTSESGLIWVFTTDLNSAHPSVIKVKSSKGYIKKIIGTRCESTKSECDSLIHNLYESERKHNAELENEM